MEGVRVWGKGKGYNHARDPNAMSSQNRDFDSRLTVSPAIDYRVLSSV